MKGSRDLRIECYSTSPLFWQKTMTTLEALDMVGGKIEGRIKEEEVSRNENLI